MKEIERRSALACLAAVEDNVAELLDIPEYRSRLGGAESRYLMIWGAWARAQQHELRRLKLVSERDG